MTVEDASTARLEVREMVGIDAVARTRSFTIAANAINTTQPTLSRLVASAEQKLNTPLFRRGWSGAETTPGGDIVARTCGAAISAISAAEGKVFEGRKSAPSFRLNLRSAHLAAIEAVTRDGSVSLAARRMGRSQPDLSRTLSDFSKHFQIDLFQRTASGMLPLPAAVTLTELSGTVSYLLDRLPEQLNQLRGEIVGRVAVGMLPFSGQDLISATFARLGNLHPNIRLACVPGSYNGLVEALRRREIDRIVGILRMENCPPGLAETHLYDERFAVIARQDHPLQTSGESLAELARTKWVVAPHGTPVRAHFEAVFAALNLTPPTQTCEMLSFSAAEQMLVESLSVAMLTYSERKLRSLRPQLKEVRTPFLLETAPIGMTKLADATDDAALDAFDKILGGLVVNEA